MNKPTEVKIICPRCHGHGNPCAGDEYIGIAPMMCRGKGYILAQLWQRPQTEETNNGQQEIRKRKQIH